MTLAVSFADHGELAAQYLGQEVAVAARGFEEAAVDAFGLLFDHVEHGVDLTLVGKDLAVLFDALFRLDLCCHWKPP